MFMKPSHDMWNSVSQSPEVSVPKKKLKILARVDTAAYVEVQFPWNTISDPQPVLTNWGQGQDLDCLECNPVLYYMLEV